ncbi:hypothetical protein [Rhodococcoides fascians]|uniref:hypothetical protein n=1 Tax=Rhodococcoides fascians TaxID=1828 RepID=UPI00050C1452|nr:hypothetical protein [Rhodococcus fascians]
MDDRKMREKQDGVVDAEVQSQYSQARDGLDKSMARLNEQIELLAMDVSPARSEEAMAIGESGDKAHHGSSQIVRHIDRTAWGIDAVVEELTRIRREIEL